MFKYKEKYDFMVNKKIVIGITCCLIVSVIAALLFLEKNETEQSSQNESNGKSVQNPVKHEKSVSQEKREYNS